MPTKEYKFFRELISIPMVNFSIQAGANAYYNLKKYHEYMDTTLTTTEDLIAFLVKVPPIQKVAETLETPLCYVDNLASEGLHLLEHKYPSIRMSPEELKDESKKQMIVLRGAGAKRLEDLMREICRRRRQGFHIAMNYLEEHYGKNLSVYVDLIDRKLDKYLPPLHLTGKEVVPCPRQDERVLDRMAHIPQVVKQRLTERYHHYIVKITVTDEPTKEVEGQTIGNDEVDGHQVRDTDSD